MDDNKVKAIFNAVKDFNWANYGMDEIEFVESDEWARDLATAIAVAIDEKE